MKSTTTSIRWFPLLSSAVVARRGWRRRSQAARRPAAPLQFRAQEIATDFGVGYAVAPGDVNGDKRIDILAISGTDLVWFQAPTWEKNVILAAGATTADNVTLAPHDIDGDGRLDVALGAGWTRQNTGTLQWVKQNAPGTTPAWEVFPISAEPTLHRIKWADVDGDKKLELIVAPLHGKGAKGRTGTARARGFSSSGRRRIPRPTRGRWRWPARRITSSTTSCR